MKRIGVYLLILALFSTDNVIKEFLKTPLLINHFIVHQQKDPSIGLLRFMAMHYFGKDLNDNDQSQDMKLPFKKISSGPHHALFQAPSLPIDQFCRITYLSDSDQVYKDHFFINHSFEKPYRPPQLKNV